MRTLISFAALLLSALFIQLGSGSLAPLDALSGQKLGFTTGQIGLLGSSHFIGFFIGCFVVPRLMGQIGHSRTFAALAAIGAMAALLHPIIIDPYFWAILRIGTGLAIAGGYTVIESWMQAKVDNQHRGRVLGTYRFVDLIGSLGAQLMIAVLEPAHYVSYNIVAIFCCICLLPLTMTKAKAPVSPETPKVRPLKAWRLSPLGVAGVIVTGLTNSSFRMVGPIYAVDNGLKATEVALFLASAVLGGALSQPLMGWIADKFDRRKVLIAVSAAALGASMLIGTGAIAGAFYMIFVSAFVFGAVTFPLFSVSSAHANDFAKPEYIIELNASLMFFYAVGAIISPYFSAKLIENFGPGALFIYISVAHIALIAFGLYRMTRRETIEIGSRTAYRWRPRTSMVLDKLFSKK